MKCSSISRQKKYFDHSFLLKIEVVCIHNTFSSQNIFEVEPSQHIALKQRSQWNGKKTDSVCPWKMKQTCAPRQMPRSLVEDGASLQPPEILLSPLPLWRALNLSPSMSADKRHHHREHIQGRTQLLQRDTVKPTGVYLGLRSSCQQLPQRTEGRGTAAEQWRVQAVCSHFMIQTIWGQEIQVATWPGHELQHKWIVLTNRLWSIKPNKTCCIMEQGSWH